MRYIFYALVCNLCLFSQATMEFSKERVEQVNYWIINGQVDLPERNWVNITLYLDSYLVPRSEKMVYVRQGRFSYKFPIKKRILPGNYEIKLIYKKNNKRQIETQKEYVGNPQNEVKKRKEYNLFIRSFVDQVSVFHEQLQQQSSEYLKEKPSPPKVDEISGWHQQMEEQLVGMQKNIRQHSARRVLIPYSFKSIKKMQNILTYCEGILNSEYQKILVHLKLSKSEKKILNDSRTKLYKNNIVRLINEIKKDEEFAEFLDEKSVQQDLAWINSIYGNFSDLYIKLQTKFGKTFWEEKRQNFVVQIQNFEKRLKDYEKSIFMKKHPKILQDFNGLVNLLNEVSDVYTRELYNNARINLPADITTTRDVSELQNAIKDSFFSIFNKMQGLMSKEEKEKIKLLAQMEEALVKISSMQQEIQDKYMFFIESRQQEKFDKRKLTRWQKKWESKIIGLTADTNKILILQRTHRLKNIPVSWYFFIKYLKSIDYNFKKIMEMQQSPNMMVGINKDLAQIQKMTNSIRLAIAKEK
ncbi:hypothetical protein [Candidatus Uabimicrobium sp. HlEnr_7]|uniref:hypothetical protein n=1 Tax=Candidatus Uabimicrobium helgolandensis TaxID=3095367 RepID=UPI003558D284